MLCAGRLGYQRPKALGSVSASGCRHCGEAVSVGVFDRFIAQFNVTGGNFAFYVSQLLNMWG
ncbi:MAG: hypothetical protein WCD24_17915 [Serratia inhibens]|uniref:hypothetical protein n=1 Tax=Serratia inhibens TaxID=2338073 RepID=UPI003C7DBD8B